MENNSQKEWVLSYIPFKNIPNQAFKIYLYLPIKVNQQTNLGYVVGLPE